MSPPASMSEAFTMIDIVLGSLVAVFSIFVSITALKISRESKEITEKMMKVQVVHNDRKRALNILVSIMNTRNYKELLKRFFEFTSSLDWVYVPLEIRKAVASEVNKLIRFYHEENPLEPEYSAEELEAMQEQVDEAQRDEWKSMDPVQRFDRIFGEKMNQTRSNIEDEIRKYLIELGD